MKERCHWSWASSTDNGKLHPHNTYMHGATEVIPLQWCQYSQALPPLKVIVGNLSKCSKPCQFLSRVSYRIFSKRTPTRKLPITNVLTARIHLRNFFCCNCCLRFKTTLLLYLGGGGGEIFERGEVPVSLLGIPPMAIEIFIYYTWDQCAEIKQWACSILILTTTFEPSEYSNTGRSWEVDLTLSSSMRVSMYTRGCLHIHTHCAHHKHTGILGEGGEHW